MPRQNAGVEGTLAEACSLLEQLGLRYAVVGGLAVGAWGVNRSTDDVDIFAELPGARRKEILRALRRMGFDVPAMEEELTKFGVFRSRSKHGIFLDLFDSVGPLGDAILENRREVAVGKRNLWFVSPAELTLLKAFSERERDFDDLTALLKVLGRKLDLEYIRSWTKRLDESVGSHDVSERLERALSIKGAQRRR